VRERPEPLDALYREYAGPLREAGVRYEFVVVCQPWYESMAAPLLEMAAAGEPIRVLQLAQSTGEATMLKVAAERARGDVLVTLPGYRRVPAPVLLDLLRRLGSADLALAVRWPRRDSWINRVQNMVFHRVVRWLSGSSFRDLACGVRAMRRQVIEDTPLYGDFFRFLPLLAQREGFDVIEVESAQHPEDRQPRVYAPGVYLRRALDLLGMFFLLRFTDKPLRFFGLVGSASALVGFLVLAVLSVQRLQGEPLADRPVLLLGVLLIVLGAQAVALGLIGEMIVYHHAHQRRRYRLAERVREPDPEAPGSAGPASSSGTHASDAALATPAQPPPPSARPDPGPVGVTSSRGPWRTLVRLAIGLGLLAWLLSRIDFSRRTIELGSDVVLGIAVTVALLVLAQAVSALRWREILGAAAPTWGYLFRLYLIGNFFSLFLPTSVGGDAVRAVAASRALPTSTPAVTSVVVDRLIGVVALLAYLALGILVAPAVVAQAGTAAEWQGPGLALGGALALALLAAIGGVAWLVRRPTVRRRLAPAGELIGRLWRSPGTLARILGLGLAVQALYILAWGLLASALGVRLPPALFVATVPVVSLLAMLPVSLSGIGIREGAWVLLLAPFGVAAADALTYSLVFFVAFAVVGGIGGVVYSLMGTSLGRVPVETT
jgi:uncharacterized membrane protein YbhN (UPF0104 family)